MDVEHARWEELTAAEDRALAMLDAIEREGLIAPGRSEIEVNRAIAELAERVSAARLVY